VDCRGRSTAERDKEFTKVEKIVLLLRDEMSEGQGQGGETYVICDIVGSAVVREHIKDGAAV
jgi:hypothetical protein